jgi:hypothetical protein
MNVAHDSAVTVTCATIVANVQNAISVTLKVNYLHRLVDAETYAIRVMHGVSRAIGKARPWYAKHTQGCVPNVIGVRSAVPGVQWIVLLTRAGISTTYVWRARR